jgi:hypothetical protein
VDILEHLGEHRDLELRDGPTTAVLNPCVSSAAWAPMQKYRLVAKKGEGTFSEVLKAQSVKSNRFTAIKCMKNRFDSIDQVNNLREIQALRRLSPHPNIIKLIEVLYDQPTGRLALVFELMEMNIYELIRGRRHYLSESRIRSFMYALTKAMDHMHRNGIFHRDIKPVRRETAERQRRQTAERQRRQTRSACCPMHARSCAASAAAVTVPRCSPCHRAHRAHRAHCAAAVLVPLPQRRSMLVLTGEHPHLGRRAEARRLRLVPRHIQQTAVHRVHLDALVSSAGMSADRRLLQLQDGYLGSRLRVL